MSAQDCASTPGDTFLVDLEVLVAATCICGAGYAAAKANLLSAELEQLLVYLNRRVFTPCLVFVKLGPEVHWHLLPEVAVIPAFYALQTLASWVSCLFLSSIAGLRGGLQNVAVANSVCGSTDAIILPLILLLVEASNPSVQCLKSNNVPRYSTTRGLTYMVLFQQLCHLNLWIIIKAVLPRVAPHALEDAPIVAARDIEAPPAEEGIGYPRNTDQPCEETRGAYQANQLFIKRRIVSKPILENVFFFVLSKLWVVHPTTTPSSSSLYNGSTRHPQSSRSNSSPSISTSTSPDRRRDAASGKSGSQRLHAKSNEGGSVVLAISEQGITMNYRASCEPLITPGLAREGDLRIFPQLGPTPCLRRYGSRVKNWAEESSRKVQQASRKAADHLPHSIWAVSAAASSIMVALGRFMRTFVAPSFAALVAAVVVGSNPALKHSFFTKEAFINSSFVSSASQLADVAVPAWLFVTGGRAARSTMAPTTSSTSHPSTQAGSSEDVDVSTLIIVSLLSRMLLPVIFVSALFALLTKNERALVFNDPSFLLVGVLVAGSPAAYELVDLARQKKICPNLMPRIVQQMWSVWTFLYVFVLLGFATAIVQVAQGQRPGF